VVGPFCEQFGDQWDEDDDLHFFDHPLQSRRGRSFGAGGLQNRHLLRELLPKEDKTEIELNQRITLFALQLIA